MSGRRPQEHGGDGAPAAGPSMPFDDGFGERSGSAGSRGRRRRRGRRALVGVGVTVLLLIGALSAAIFLLSEQIGGNVERVPDVFAGLGEGSRPPVTGALTFVVVGTDSRAAQPTMGTVAAAGADPGSQRSDVVMVVRIGPDRRQAAVVSVPRDSWVDIPGRGPGKINEAYSFGGPALLVGTIENLTKIRVDHFAVIDFAGFREIVDAVGGIDVAISAATSNDGVDFRQGVNHLDGAQSLAFVRQRYDLPGGDLDRAQRQQSALRSLLSRTASGGTLTDPLALYRLLDAASRSIGVDAALTNGGLRALGLELVALRPHAVAFLTAPVSGLGREGEQSVVYLDEDRSTELWAALGDSGGGVAAYQQRNPGDTLGIVTP